MRGGDPPTQQERGGWATAPGPQATFSQCSLSRTENRDQSSPLSRPVPIAASGCQVGGPPEGGTHQPAGRGTRSPGRRRSRPSPRPTPGGSPRRRPRRTAGQCPRAARRSPGGRGAAVTAGAWVQPPPPPAPAPGAGSSSRQPHPRRQPPTELVTPRAPCCVRPSCRPLGVWAGPAEPSPPPQRESRFWKNLSEPQAGPRGGQGRGCSPRG